MKSLFNKIKSLSSTVKIILVILFTCLFFLFAVGVVDSLIMLVFLTLMWGFLALLNRLTK